MGKKIELLVAGILGLVVGGVVFGLGVKRGVREAQMKHPASTEMHSSAEVPKKPVAMAPPFPPPPPPPPRVNTTARQPAPRQNSTRSRFRQQRTTVSRNASVQIERIRERLEQQRERDPMRRPRMRGAAARARAQMNARRPPGATKPPLPSKLGPPRRDASLRHPIDKAKPPSLGAKLAATTKHPPVAKTPDYLARRPPPEEKPAGVTA